MRILWLSHLVPYPPKGGVLQRAYHLLKQTAREHEVDLVAFVQNDLMRTHFRDERSGLRESSTALDFCRSTTFVGIPMERWPAGRAGLAGLSLLTPHPYTINWLRSARYRAAIAELAARRKFDLVHFDTISLVPYRDEFGPIPATLDHHNVESQMMLRRSEQEGNSAKKAYFRQEGTRLQRYERRVCGGFGSNLMCSDLDARRLEEICPDAVTDVIPNGVDLEYFKPAPVVEPLATRCIFAGRLNAYTNAQSVRFIVRELWPRLRDSVPGVSFDLVGSNPPQDALDLAKTDERVRVTGYVDDVRPFLDAAGIYVCPMFDGGGTKLKMLDAMAMQKPIVASSLAVEGIDVRDGEHVLLAETAHDFVNAIARLSRDRMLAQRLASAARQLVLDRYSYESIGAVLTSVLERVRATRANAR
jgi:glycosyltransferase involved in cell wall biosynthesis